MESKVSGYLNDYPNINQSNILTERQKKVLSLLLSESKGTDEKIKISYSEIVQRCKIPIGTVYASITKLKSLNIIMKVSYEAKVNNYTINYNTLREFEDKLSKGIPIDVRTKTSHNTEITDNRYEELSKRIDDLERVVKDIQAKFTSLVTVTEMLVSVVNNIITDQRKLTSKLLGINR